MDKHLNLLSPDQLASLTILVGFMVGGMFGTQMRIETETFIFDKAFNQGYERGYINGFKHGLDAYYIPRQHTLLPIN